MDTHFPVIDGHIHVIPAVKGRNRFGEVKSDRWGRALRGSEYVPLLPSMCADSTYPVEALVELMDREGVTQGVLLQNPTLGTCNEYILECTQRFPERFCGVIQVDPRDPKAAETIQEFASDRLCTLKLEMSYDWGWAGIHKGFLLNEPGMQPIWDAVETHDLEVIIDPGPPGNPGYQVGAFDALTSRMDSTRFVFAHLGYLTTDQQSDENALDMRMRLLKLAQKPNVWLGLSAVPILLNEAYPCPNTVVLLKEAIDLVGTEKLIWGSDGPVTFNLHTYRQLIDTVLREADFLSDSERRQILHDNAKTVFQGLGK